MTAEDRGFALAPTKKDLNPWYSSKASREADRDVADDEDCRERKKGDDRRWVTFSASFRVYVYVC